MGVTLAEVQTHVKEKIPALKEGGISRTTLHELLVAPRKGTRNSKRYHSLVDARVPGKDNTIRKIHADSHFAFAQVHYVMELCAAFGDECAVMSCDDMNKINVGTLAVARYHQLGQFFPVNDVPRYADHDFPFRNSKIIP